MRPMTTRTRAFAVLSTFVITFLATATAANAATPNSPDWPEPEPSSTLDILLHFGGATLALIVVISLFALLTARNNYTPPPPSQDVEKSDAHH